MKTSDFKESKTFYLRLQIKPGFWLQFIMTIILHCTCTCCLRDFSLPCFLQILCIHLKRFKHEMYFSAKINNFISFPLTGLDMKPFVVKGKKLH